MSGENHPSSLDDAWGAWVRGDRDAALRACIALLEADLGQIHAATLLSECLVAAKSEVGGRAAGRLVLLHVERGDLPRAVSSARLAERAGVASAPHLAAIAKAFGRGGARLADVSPAPPPLPVVPDTIDPGLRKAKGAALVKRGEAAWAAFEARAEPATGSPLPRLPLFSALSAADLTPLLGAFDVRDLSAGERAVVEGTEGREAFVVVRGHVRAQRGEGDDASVLADLGPGAIFGEMALVSDAPRAASVTALEPSRLLVATREALDKLAKGTPVIGRELSAFCRARMVSNLMRHSKILRAVAADERDALMARFEPRSFKAGERLVTFEQEPSGLFLIASGGVRVLGRDSDGEALRIADLGPGDVVGEISLVLRRPATADVVATYPTVALELTREQFQEAIRAHPSLLGELYELATKREDEMRTVVAQEALDLEAMVLL